MSFKRRVGTFLILFGIVALLVFAASLLAGAEARFDLTAFVAAAVMLTVGVNMRLSKSSDSPLVTRATSQPAAKAGAPGGGGGKSAGGKPGGPPKKQGALNTIMKGPANKRLPPKPPPAAGGGGKPPAGKKKK
jgi:hypothetical protein